MSTLQAGYDCTFVTPLTEDLPSECSVCLHVLREPHIVGCCGNRFCRTCIDPIRMSINRCPLCKKAFTTLPDKHLERTLNGKIVYCSHKPDGCDWTGRLVDLKDHLSPGKQNRCLYEKTKCLYCEELFLRNEIKEHEQKCPSKQIPCSYCKVFKDTASRLESVHYDTCPMYPVLCPNDCGAKIFRKNLEKHVNVTCPKTVMQCTFKCAGCNAEMSREDMAEHCSTDNMPMHLALAMEKIVNLEAENTRLKTNVKDMAQITQDIAHLKEQTITENTNLKEANDILTEQLRSKDLDLERKISEIAVASINHLEVGNLPFGTDEQMIKSLFGQYGKVDSITFREYEGDGTWYTRAEVKYLWGGDAKSALSQYLERGIKLKSQQLSVKPVFD